MSSIIFVQVGQCGNQLGNALWDALSVSTSGAPSPFFCRDGSARCVLVDSEPKVVMGLHQAHPKRYHTESLVCGQCGRGNHWALGYYGVGANGSRRDPRHAKTKAFQQQKDQRHDDVYLLQRALCALHREATRVDNGQLEGIVVVHSVAGGTGSGFASLLVEKIRMHFTEPVSDKARREAEDHEENDGLSGILGERRRAMYVISISVAPQLQGENALQGINTALTMRSLLRSVDAVILLRNDDVVNPSQHSLIHPAATLQECNATFAAWLMPVLHFGRSTRCVGELIEKLAPDGRYKVLTVVPLPQRSLIKYKRSALLSREYRYVVAASHQRNSQVGGALRTDRWNPSDMHLESSAAMIDVTHTVAELGRAPPALADYCATISNGRITLPTSVLVMNQTEELNRAVMFPLLRDAALKVQAQAFVSDFLSIGMSMDALVAAYREVASLLLYEEDV